MIIDLGETWSSDNYEVRDTAGTLQAGSTVTGTITLPDGSTTTATIQNPSTGIYTVDYLTVQAGFHDVLVSATGGVLGSMVKRWKDSFTAEEARLIVSVDQTVAHLRGQDTITEPEQLEQLRWLIQVATDAVERASGRTMVRRTITEPYDGGRDHIRLRRGPILSVTSVTENGILVPASGWVLDQRHDRLYRGTTLGTWCWEPGLLNVVPTLVAGYTVSPLIARQVALRGIARMWQSSQQMPMQYIDDDQANEVVVTTVTNLGPLEMQAWLSLKKVKQA